VARVWIAVDGKKKVWKLPEAPVHVGSGEGAQIRLDDPEAAGRHCRIEKTPDGWKVSLLSEDAPILVNGKPVAEHYLAQGDVIKVGGTEIHFELLEGAPAAPAPKVEAGVEGGPAAASRRAPSRRRAGTAGARSRGGGAASSSRRSRPAGRSRRSSRGEEDLEERPRGRRYRQPQGLPGWATGLLVLAGTAVAVLVILAVIRSMSPAPDLARRALTEAIQMGDFDRAYERLGKARGVLSEEELAEWKDKIEKAKQEDALRQKQARMQNDFLVHIKKFEESKAVRVQKLKYRIFDLMIRCQLFLQDYPDSPYADEVRRIMDKYRGEVDMENPEWPWIVSMVRYPYEKSQHHKRFDRSFRLIQLVKAKYPQFNNAEQMGKLEAETLRFANMYGRREVEDFCYKKIIQGGEKSIPVINEEIKDLNWMIQHVGVPQWVERGKQALKDLLAYRDKVARELEGR